MLSPIISKSDLRKEILESLAFAGQPVPLKGITGALRGPAAKAPKAEVADALIDAAKDGLVEFDEGSVRISGLGRKVQKSY